MSNSKLVKHTNLSPNYSSRAGQKITKVTIHHMAGNLSIERCGQVFDSASRQASSNYGVGTDGRVGMYVEEKNRAWTSSNKANDMQAVTIEVANDTYGGSWHVSDKALAATIELVTDICKRNDIKELKYTGTPSGNLTLHEMFANTNCPGPYLKSKMPYIVKQVNAKLKPAPVVKPTTATTGDDFLVKIINDAIYVIDGPKYSAKVVDTVKKGEVFTITDVENNYGKLKSGAGWIYLGYTERLKDTNTFKPYTVKVMNAAIYVIDGPMYSAKVVETVKQGEVFTIIEEKNGYGKLKSGAGWIYLGYTSKM